MKRIFLIASIVCFFGAFVAHSTNQGIVTDLVFVGLGIILMIAYFKGENP